MPTIEEIKTALGGAKSSKIQESFQKYSAELPSSAKLFAPIEQLEGEIRDKDKIIENLKNESIELKNQVSKVEEEKSTILKELEKSRWLESKAVVATKKVYDDKVETINNENVDSKIIPVLTAVGRRKQGNQQLTWSNWLKITENRYLFQVNESIAKSVYNSTNDYIHKKLGMMEKSPPRGGGVPAIKIYGLDFDGLTNEVTTNFSGSGATPLNKTYSWWMKSTETARNYSVFGYGTNKRGTFTPNFSSGRVLMWNGNSWYTYWDDTSAQDDGEWHHWMVYNDVETIVDSKLYVDGTLQNVERNVTSGTVSNLLTYTQPLTIGAYKNNSTNTGHHFEGSITNFAVYSGDKTDDASAHYNNGTPKDLSGESDLQGYWKMDEGKGSTVTDRSGEGNDGTIDGASWFTILDTQGREGVSLKI
jgi:hypothetical protein